VSDEQPGDHLSIRISNQDRERVAQILHNALGEGRLEISELEERLDAVYAAKTFADLEPVTRDLPVQAHGTLPAVQPKSMSQSLPPSRFGAGTTGPSQSIAIMSGVVRKGAWVVPPHHTAVAVMGGVEIDLTDAKFVERITTIQVFAFWGGVEIRVPADVHVQVDGIGFMGAFEDKSMGLPSPDRPIVRVTGFAMMAGVEVKPSKKKPAGEIEGQPGHRDRDF
jgi:hypothetical protein